MIKLLICDWDDVFTWGSTKGYMACYHAAAIGVGVNLPPEEERARIQSQWGKPHTEELATLLAEYPERVEDAARIYEQHLFGGTFVAQLSAAPNVDQLLTRLASKYKLALVTGVHPVLLRDQIFPKFNIPAVFDAVCSTYDLADPSLAKPNPYVANELMAQFDVEPDQTVVIGDARNDVLLAQRSGAEPIVVLSGHLTRLEAEQMGVTRIIPDITHIEKELALQPTRQHHGTLGQM